MQTKLARMNFMAEMITLPVSRQYGMVTGDQ